MPWLSVIEEVPKSRDSTHSDDDDDTDASEKKALGLGFRV